MGEDSNNEAVSGHDDPNVLLVVLDSVRARN